MRWFQQPPHSECRWLAGKVCGKAHTDDATGETIKKGDFPHHMQPPPEVRYRAAESDDLTKRLEKASMCLWLVDVEDKLHAVSDVLHGCKPVVQYIAAEDEYSLRWPDAGCLRTPKQVAAKAGIPTERLRRWAAPAVDGRGSHGDSGHFRLAVVVPDEAAKLWLMDSAGVPANIRVSADSAKRTWKPKQRGPYADHSECTPSHIGQNGERLCKTCDIVDALDGGQAPGEGECGARHKRRRQLVNSDSCVAAVGTAKCDAARDLFQPDLTAPPPEVAPRSCAVTLRQ